MQRRECVISAKGHQPSWLRPLIVLASVALGASSAACVKSDKGADSADSAENAPSEPSSAGAQHDEAPDDADEGDLEDDDASEEMRCIFIVEDSCYSSYEEACSALACPNDGCTVTPSLPPKVQCKNDEGRP
jgi:hypothetical protein